MSEALEFTTAEVAFVLREPVSVIRKALDHGPVRTKLVKKPGGAVRSVEWPDLIYLYAIRGGLQDELTPKARNQFYDALKSVSVEKTSEVHFGLLRVFIGDVKAEVWKRAQELTKLAEKVEFRSDGEAVLKGTDVEVHRIAALLSGGMTATEICEDYPSLTAETVATAKAYAEAYPKTGRPYPSKTVKRAIRGAGLEELDEFLDEEK